MHVSSLSGEPEGLVVIGPDHASGPRVDVEQGTARTWLALTITHAQWIAHVLAAVHALGDESEAVYPECERGKQHIHRLLSLYYYCLSLAIIVQGLDKRTLALLVLDATSVGADPHLENQIDASIPLAAKS